MTWSEIIWFVAWPFVAWWGVELFREDIRNVLRGDDDDGRD